MGAHNCFVEFPASSEKELQQRFQRHAESERFEHGHGRYSGHIGNTNGLRVHPKTFENAKSAYDFLEQQLEKYGPAIAVRVGAFDHLYPKTASDMKLETSYQDLHKIYTNWDDHLLANAKKAKSLFRSCTKCGSKIALKYLTTISCPVCMNTKFLHTESEMKKYLALQKRVTALSLKRKAAMDKYSKLNKGKNFWIVGACVPC